LQREELVAKVDEGHVRLAAAQLEAEQFAVEAKRLVNVADLDRDMVEADQAGFVRSWHERVSEGVRTAPITPGAGQRPIKTSWPAISHMVSERFTAFHLAFDLEREP